jgi:putative hemolysin
MVGGVDGLTLALLAIALLLSAFFSSSETAFISLQRIRLRHMERTGVRGVSRVRRLADQSDRTLVTILIGNNLVNTAAAALGTVIAAAVLGAEAAVLAATIAITILLLIFGEITPKTVALRHSERLALLYAIPLDFLAHLFSPLTALLSRLASAVAAMAGSSPARTAISRDEIRTVIMMGEETGVLEREETEILRSALQLRNTVVREVMVPRVEVVGIEANQTVESVARAVADKGHTWMPVYEGDLDHIVGIVHAKTVLVRYLAGEKDRPASLIMRPALFTTETKKVPSLLEEMREQQTQMAIVIDEYSGTSGIVTLEDLLEELVGEITSEYGTERKLVRSIGEREAVVEGAISIDDLNEAFGVDLPAEGVDTLGGFVSQQLGRIPASGDHFTYQDLQFSVLSVRARRVGTVRIERIQAAD